MRYFEVHLNRNLFEVAYTIEIKDKKQALRLVKKNCKANKNISFDIFEIDKDGNLLDWSSGNVLV